MSSLAPLIDLRNDRVYQEMLKLLEEQTFRQRMKRTLAGLSASRDSGDYKFAMLQLQRLSAPFLALVIPLFMVVLLIAFEDDRDLAQPITPTEIASPDAIEDLDKPPPLPDQPDFADPVARAFTDFIKAPKAAVPVENPTMSPPLNPLNAVADYKGSIIMRKIYRNRNPDARRQAICQYDGSVAGEVAVMRALRWLVKNQLEDGSWGRNKTAMTGLGLLCFLAHGETPASEEFGPAVEKGIRYLVDSLQTNGLFKVQDGNNYSHPMAAYALCEAYTLTKVPMLKTAAELAMRPIMLGQHPSGGWDYNMRQTDRDDTSYMGWCAQAVKAAKMAEDLDVPGLDEAYRLSNEGFRKNAHPEGGFGYTSPARGGLTSVGTLCMQLMGAANAPEVQKSLALMDSWVLSWDNPKPTGSPQYYFYYAAQCMFHAGGKRWTTWNNSMLPEYVKHQKILAKEESGYVDHEGDPQAIGWWENLDHYSDRPVMDTTLATLQLEVYYRYLPTFRTPKVLDQEVVFRSEDDAPVRIQF